MNQLQEWIEESQKKRAELEDLLSNLWHAFEKLAEVCPENSKLDDGLTKVQNSLEAIERAINKLGDLLDDCKSVFNELREMLDEFDAKARDALAVFQGDIPT